MAHFTAIPLIAALALASACSQPGVRASQPVVTESTPQPAVAATSETESVAPVAAPAAVADSSYPKIALTPDILFKFLVAEVAGQRGALQIAQATYLDLARDTQDPRLAQRAAEMSLFARDQAGALEATRLWVKGEQDSERGRQTLAALLLNDGKIAEAEPVLRRLLQEDPARGFMQLYGLLAKVKDTRAALDLVTRLAAEHPKLPEAQFAIAQASAQAGRFDEAGVALQRADALRPGWEAAALLRAQILSKSSRADALAFMRTFLDSHPDARDVRLAYARTLVAANQFTEARAEFTRLTQDFPRNAEVGLAAGLLTLQMGDAVAARDILTQTLDYSPRDPDTVQYYLGQVAEQLKDPAAANAHYAEVKSGNYLVSARARQAALLFAEGKLEAASALLANTRAENPAQAVRLIQARAELLRESKVPTAAFDVLSEGLKRFPDSPELLYDRAMAAEKLDRLDVLEADLRRAIVLRPGDAQAYNALGYTLADRTPRLAEAIALLDKALALAPDDPFILDSVGWAQYRSGNLARAQEYLERAYKVRPDPEIAAHLGEVLWARGQRDEAGKLWQSGLQVHPQNEILLETLRRLKP